MISLHVPLFDSTRHIINAASIAKMRKGVVIINTSRGALIDTPHLIQVLDLPLKAVASTLHTAACCFFHTAGHSVRDFLYPRRVWQMVVFRHDLFSTERRTPVPISSRLLTDVLKELRPSTALVNLV